MAKKSFVERYENKIVEELKEKGVCKKKEIANKYGCDIGQVMSIAKKHGIDSKEETQINEVKTELDVVEKVALAKALLDARGNVSLAASMAILDKDLCVKAAENFYHPKYANLPDRVNHETVKFKVLEAIMVLNFNKREDVYEILKEDSWISKSFLVGVTSSHIASALFNLKQDGLVEQEYLPGVKKSPTIRISQMTSEQFYMVAEAVGNDMGVTDIADMLGCSAGMVYDVFRTRAYQNAKRWYEKSKESEETKLEPVVELTVNGPAAHEVSTDTPTTLEELNNKHRALETAYNSKLTELQQIKDDMEKIKTQIKKLQEKEDILKKVEELDRQKKMLMEQLQTL